MSNHVIQISENKVAFDQIDSGKNQGMTISIYDANGCLFSDWFTNDQKIELIKFLLDTI